MKSSNEYPKILGLIILVSFSLLLAGCKGEKGDVGPMGPAGSAGPTGPTGPAGINLINAYVGVLNGALLAYVSVPELIGHEATRFVLVYWAYPTSPETWIPATDGWDDGSASHVVAISWTQGRVYFAGFEAGILFKINVYQNN